MKRAAYLALIGWLATAMPIGAQQANPKTATERLEESERQIGLLWQTLLGLEERTPGRSAKLDCDSARYAELLPGTGYTVFAAACERIEPYMEGYRVMISLGNPHSAKITNVKGNLIYGESIGSLKKAEWSIGDDLAAGSWKRFTVTVNPAQAKDMRLIFLDFEATTMTLTPR